ncbi:hypothetical protein MYX04_11795 [Nitrospiraceae bacterium AH_259_D15_M11_P09]|nr:hypothetical protein [Nitrospiraceae bacterium AH_259_D15_M11_P09]
MQDLTLNMRFNVIVLAIPIAINVALYSMLGALLYAGWEFVGWVTR